MAERFEKVLMIGCGNMAGAMLQGWLAGGLDPARFTVADPGEKDLPAAITQHRSIPQSGDFDAILLGVKPQMLDDVAPEVARLAGEGTTVLSLLAGVELATLTARFPDAGACVRVMPNLAVALGKSPIALAESGLDEARRAEVLALMEPLGTPEWVGEAEFDLVSALAGSGPACRTRAAARTGRPPGAGDGGGIGGARRRFFAGPRRTRRPRRQSRRNDPRRPRRARRRPGAGAAPHRDPACRARPRSRAGGGRPRIGRWRH
jgi:hypothetical protein